MIRMNFTRLAEPTAIKPAVHKHARKQFQGVLNIYVHRSTLDPGVGLACLGKTRLLALFLSKVRLDTSSLFQT